MPDSRFSHTVARSWAGTWNRLLGVSHGLALRLSRLAGRRTPSAWFYGASYFGAGRRGGRGGVSGYERYDRTSSHANEAAYLVWRHLRPRRALDVGCALGLVVQALREVGVEAWGVDLSRYAVTHGPSDVRRFLTQGDLLRGLPFPSGSFEVVTCLETLEHLRPEDIDAALAELARVSSRYVLATIPSFGPNPFGTHGWLEGKVRDGRLAHYKSLGESYDGPVPFDDLARDRRGDPVEGHLTIASFRWWTERFERAGFVRRGDLERVIEQDIGRFQLLGAWNLYVLERRGVPEPFAPERSEAERLDLERRWSLPPG